MPHYDYVCQRCGHLVEVVHGVHDAGPQACEKCAGPMRKGLSAPSIHFKGSGWAKKDAARQAPATGKKAESGEGVDKPASKQPGAAGGESSAGAAGGESTAGAASGGSTGGAASGDAVSRPD